MLSGKGKELVQFLPLTTLPDSVFITFNTSFMITFMRFLLLTAIVMMIGCRKDPMNNLSEGEQRIYITNYDKSADFKAYRTFSIADRVVVVDGNNSSQQSSRADQALMQELGRALQSRGFMAAASSTTADLGVQISRIVRTSTGFITGPDYYGYWDPGYWGFGGGWGPGMGWGPGYSVMPYEVREGMLAIDIIDLRNNNSPRILWNALIRGPGLSDVSAVNDIVENVLNVSPYLKTN
jgi:hypothetical protein